MTAVVRQGVAPVALLATTVVSVGAFGSVLVTAEAVFWPRVPRVWATHVVVVSATVGKTNVELASLVAASDVVEAAASCEVGRVRARIGEHVGQVLAAEVSSDFLSVLDTRPLVGRDFTAADETAGDGAVIVGERFWRDRLGGQSSILGARAVLAGIEHTVIGVVPRRLDVLGGADVFILRRRTIPGRIVDLSATGSLRLEGVVARLEKPYSPAIAEQLAAVFPRRDPARRIDTRNIEIRPLGALIRGHGQPLMLGVAVAALCLLALGVSNIVLMYEAWMRSRTRDLATRVALGATGRALAWSSVREAAVLVGTGVLGGLLVSAWASRILTHTVPRYAHLIGDPRVGWRTVVVAGGLLVLALAASGSANARRVSRMPVAAVLAGSWAHTESASQKRLHRGILVVQLAMSAALLCVAVAAARALLDRLRVEPGFRADGLVAFELWRAPLAHRPGRAGAGRHEPPGSPDASVSPDDRIAEIVRYDQAVMDALRQIPGIEVVGATSSLPLAGTFPNAQWVDTGDPRVGAPAELISVAGSPMTALGIPLIRGRDFSPEDERARAGSVIVNDHLARQLWPGEDPLGRTMTLARGDPRTVIGVVGTVPFGSGYRGGPAQVYVLNCRPVHVPAALSFVLRTQRSPRDLAQSIRMAVARVDPDAVVFGLTTGRDLVRRASEVHRARVAAILALTCAAIVLTIAGTLGTTAHWVAERQREIALRQVLGARSADIVRFAVRPAGLVALLGSVSGTLGGWIVARVLSTVWGDLSVGPWDVTIACTVSSGLVPIATGLAAARAVRAQGLPGWYLRFS